MARMHDDIRIRLQRILERAGTTDTGTAQPRPHGLIGIAEAAAIRGVSETTMRRRCRALGIAIKVGKTWLVPVQVLPALPTNDTGMLDDVRHDVELISGLTDWPISLSTTSEAQTIPVMWDELDPKGSAMQAGFAPSQSGQRYPETVKLRIPAGMSATLQYVARRRAQSTSDWIRQALLDRLHQEGLVLMDTGAVRRVEDL
jgi:hypothetical protein